MTKHHMTPNGGGGRTETIYGVHPVFEALKANRRAFRKIYVSSVRAGKMPPWLKDLSVLADSRRVPVESVSSSRLGSLSGTDGHQGIAARVDPYPLSVIDDLIGDQTSMHRFLLLLDHVVDPHNFGALVRTAHCAGVQGIIVPKDRSAPPTPAVSKVSAGALEHVPMARVTNMVNTIKALKKRGIWVIGLDGDARESIFAVDFPLSLAIVIGGEQKGIRPLVKKHCDRLCAIPQSGKIDSLNASVAGAIAMYEIYRQRDASKGS